MKALGFTGRGSEYFRIWIVNILLTIVTLSIYYPWAKVRTRRYFHGSTTLEGRSFDYHATGKQLLPGHLIVLVLVLLYVGLQVIFPIAGFVLIAILALGAPWIIWRSLSFNARMTSFSTVRFGFEGTAGGAYLNYLLMPLLLVASLLLGPLVTAALSYSREASQESNVLLISVVSLSGYALAFLLYCKLKKCQTRYVIRGYRYGQGRFTSTVRARGFAVIFLKTVGLSLLAVLGIIALIVVLAFVSGAAADLMSLADKIDDPESLRSAFNSGAVLILLSAVYVGFLFVMMLIFAYAHTRQRTYVYGNSRLDDRIALASTLGARRFAWVLLSNLLLVVVTLGLGLPWAMTRMARVLLEHTEVDTSAGFDAYVTQQRATQSSLGDQLGDAFDVDVGIGF